ncbi:hypothetical protein BGZ51_000744 [Haplosporangium sp. Z 767]|nr:hypothetical protein BGZ51_000744 [Haplosporangium sp. Z 767]
MGRPVGRNLEDEMMTKIRKLFDQILDTVNKENPTYTFDFEQFVDCFDENDHFTKRVFEFLVKETAQRYRSSHPNAQHPAHPRPHTIHHYSGQDSNSGTSGANANVAVIADASTSGALVSPRRSNQLRFRAHHSLERDALIRSPSSTSGSPGLNEDTVSGASTSGSALRYLMSNQGFGYVGSRRGRINQRMVLSDELLAYQPHVRELGALPNPNLTSTRSSQNRSLSRTRAFIDSMGATISRGPTQSASESGTTAMPPSSASSIESRNAPRRGGISESQHAFIPRPSSRTNALFNSMETAPESFRSDPWRSSSGPTFTSEILLPVSIEHTGTRSSSTDRRRSEPIRQRQEQLLHAQDVRQQQIRRLYVQSLQARGRMRQQHEQQQQQQQQQQAEQQEQTQQGRTSLRQRERTLQQHQQALRALHGQRSISSEDTHAQEQQQQEQQRYQLQDNGLMLVQPYPGSPTTPTPLISSTPEDADANGAVPSITSLSALVAQIPLEERYSQFSDSTQRGRAAMRNALAAELHIEEDEQVLLTGEVSRRRRRRAVRRFPSPNASPDIASDNSSAIISQLQQQQQQQQQDHGQDQQPCESTPSSVSEAAAPQESASSTLQQEARPEGQDPLGSTNNDVSIQDTTTASTSGNIAAVTVSPPLVPTVSIELTEPNPGNTTVIESSTGSNSSSTSTGDDSSRTIGHLGLGLDPRTVHQTQDDGHPSHIIPPTPPSPNPNRNPMPTFQDRRRSSINPADIEAVVREMEANAQSAGITWVASRPPSVWPCNIGAPNK